MVAYNFQSCFAGDVASGAKRQTIRAEGKRRHAIYGEHLQLYTGMRTKGCRKLVEPDPICVSIASIYICREIFCPCVFIAGRALSESEIDAFARADGFVDYVAMLEWFGKNHGLPFKGVLIKW